MKKIPLIVAMLSIAGCGGNNGIDSPGTTVGASAVTRAETASIRQSASSTTSPTATDSAQYLMNTYQDGLNEIELGQLALQKNTNGANNSDVKRFAQRMIDDHTRINSQVSQLAQTKGITLPSDLSTEQRAEANRLGDLPGDQFNVAYMADNVTGHESDVTNTRQQATQGSDADVRLLAEATLPILKVHLAAAKEIDSLLDPAAFITNFYQDGLAEIQLAQLALQKSSDSSVKRFAQKMVDDHTTANNRIATLAQQKNVTLPTSPAPDDAAVLAELSSFSGTDFDKAYMDQNVVSHVVAVRLVRQQAEGGQDSDLKSFSQQTLPVLASHLARAIAIDAPIKPSFLYQAAQDGTAEIQLGNLATLQGSNEQVKAFGQQMITDHASLNTQIAQVAQQQNVALPTEISPQQLVDFVALMGKSGADFDRSYMDINVVSHTEDVAAANDQAQNATDANIKTLAQNMLPILTAHLTRAREVQQSLNAANQPQQ